MKVQDFINGKITYDKYGQYFFINMADGHQQMLAEMRGWGAIQNLFKDGEGMISMKEAGEFQDEVGEWIAKAINEKLERDANG